jgi:hypothetical protein
MVIARRFLVALLLTICVASTTADPTARFLLVAYYTDGGWGGETWHMKVTAEGNAYAEFKSRDGRTTCEKKLDQSELAIVETVAEEIDTWSGYRRLPSEYAGYYDAPELVLIGPDKGRDTVQLGLVKPAETRKTTAAKSFMSLWHRATKVLPRCSNARLRPKFAG